MLRWCRLAAAGCRSVCELWEGGVYRSLRACAYVSMCLVYASLCHACVCEYLPLCVCEYVPCECECV